MVSPAPYLKLPQPYSASLIPSLKTLALSSSGLPGQKLCSYLTRPAGLLPIMSPSPLMTLPQRLFHRVALLSPEPGSPPFIHPHRCSPILRLLDPTALPWPASMPRIPPAFGRFISSMILLEMLASLPVAGVLVSPLSHQSTTWQIWV